MICPICASETHADYRPFCSRGCADVDLARWFNGSYAAPSTDPDDIEAAADAADAASGMPQKPH